MYANLTQKKVNIAQFFIFPIILSMNILCQTTRTDILSPSMRDTLFNANLFRWCLNPAGAYHNLVLCLRSPGERKPDSALFLREISDSWQNSSSIFFMVEVSLRQRDLHLASIAEHVVRKQSLIYSWNIISLPFWKWISEPLLGQSW